MKQVLVVEDETELRESLCDALELAGFSAVGARDGQEALELLASMNDCGLVLLDLLMPRLDGWGFVARMRERAAWAMIPIIVHSSSSQVPPPGVHRVLMKPADLERLLDLAHALWRD